MTEICDVGIIGAGPAGLSGAINLASEGLRVSLFEGNALGGQAIRSKGIENLAGHNAITGEDLMGIAIDQATKFGVAIHVPERILSLERKEDLICLHTEGNADFCCRSVILCLGVSQRTMTATDGMGRLIGRGIEYIAMPKPGRGLHVIVGGANSAGQAAVFLGSKCKCQVLMVVRGPSLSASMSHYLIKRIQECPNIKTLFNARVTAVSGAQRLEKVVIDHNGSSETRACKSMNIFIGSEPKTFWLRSSGVKLDDKGFVLTGSQVKQLGDWQLARDPFPYETAIPGVFCAGDVRAESSKRVAAAIGDGSSVAANIHRFLALPESEAYQVSERLSLAATAR